MTKTARPVDVLAAFLLSQSLEEIDLGEGNASVTFTYGSAKPNWIGAADLSYAYMWSKDANPVVAQCSNVGGKVRQTFKFEGESETVKMLFADIRDATHKLRGVMPRERPGFPPRPLSDYARIQTLGC